MCPTVPMSQLASAFPLPGRIAWNVPALSRRCQSMTKKNVAFVENRMAAKVIRRCSSSIPRIQRVTLCTHSRMARNGIVATIVRTETGHSRTIDGNIMSLAPELIVATNSQPFTRKSVHTEYSFLPSQISSGRCGLLFMRGSVKHACHMSSLLYTLFFFKWLVRRLIMGISVPESCFITRRFFFRCEFFFIIARPPLMARACFFFLLAAASTLVGSEFQPIAWARFTNGQQFEGTSYVWLAESALQIEFDTPVAPTDFLELLYGAKNDEREAELALNGITNQLHHGGYRGFRWLRVPLMAVPLRDHLSVTLRGSGAPGSRPAFISEVRIVSRNATALTQSTAVHRATVTRVRATAPTREAFPEMRIA